MAWDVLSGVTKTAWDVMSWVTKIAWDVLSGVANLCEMFCPGWQKMAWDVLSLDALSGSPLELTNRLTDTLLGVKKILSVFTGQLVSIC